MTESPVYGYACTVKATGIIRVFLTRNVRVDKGAELDFRKLRGTPELARALRGIAETVDSSPCFQLDQELSDIQEIGYELGVLNQYLLEYEFMPSYQVVNDMSFRRKVRFDPTTQAFLLRAEPNVQTSIDKRVNKLLRDEWDNWTHKRVMISRYGLFQVTLEKRITEPTLITDILQNVLRLQQEFDLPELLESMVADLEADLARVVTGLAAIDAAATQQSRSSPSGSQPQLASFIRNNDPDWERLRERREAILREIEAIRSFKSQVKDRVNNVLDPSIQWEISREIIEQLLGTLGEVLHVDSRLPRRLFPQTVRIPFEERPVPAFTKGLSYPLRSQYVVYEFDHLYQSRAGEDQSVDTEDPRVRSELASLLESVQLVRPDGVRQWAPVKKSLLNQLFRDDASTWEQELCLFSGDNALICHDYHPHSPTLGPSFPKRVRYEEYWASVIRGIGYICELRTVTRLLENETSDDLEHTSDYRHRLHIRLAEKVRRDMRDIAIRVSSASLLVARLRNAAMPTTMATADYAALKFRRLLDRFELELSLEHSENNVSQLNDLLSHYDDLLANKTSLLVAVALSLVTVVLPILALPPFIADITGSETGAKEWAIFLLGSVFRSDPIIAATWIGVGLTLVVVVFGIVALVSAARVLFWVRFLWVRRLRELWLQAEDRGAGARRMRQR
ncbi:MAG TPA: hypothetical protein VND68_09990 [Chloroflexia bacterium]|jgi:hypothetical protein|nr:hypothetical protein [Chloroflexia bacterium]